jgi:hypothetical protein
VAIYRNPGTLIHSGTGVRMSELGVNRRGAFNQFRKCTIHEKVSGIEKHSLNAMTIDVEDYFHVLAFEDVIDRDLWESLPARVEQNTNRLLDIFADAGIKATFFILGC